VSTMLRFDAEEARKLEAVYLTPDVVVQRLEVLGVLALAPGERVVDVGSGPGLLAVEMAAAVGPTGQVCGIDVSDSMLALARGRQTPPDSAPVEYLSGGVEHIPYPDDAFDVAVSTQVLEYVADIPAALAEIRRVLRPGGRLLVLDTDWDSIVWRCGDRERMRRVLVAWEQHLADPYLPRRLTGELAAAGFDPDAPRVLPLLNVGFDPDTYSAAIVAIIAAYVVGRDGLTQDEVDAWADDLRGQGDGAFFSLNRYLFGATRPA
jgi:arsenite methyltransferase